MNKNESYHKMSGREIKEALEDEGFKSINGSAVGFSKIFKILKEPFYLINPRA